jgi:hypothetical protein
MRVSLWKHEPPPPPLPPEGAVVAVAVVATLGVVVAGVGVVVAAWQVKVPKTLDVPAAAQTPLVGNTPDVGSAVPVHPALEKKRTCHSSIANERTQPYEEKVLTVPVEQDMEKLNPSPTSIQVPSATPEYVTPLKL